MRPHKLSLSHAKVIVREFERVQVVGKLAFGANGFNQYDAALDLLTSAKRVRRFSDDSRNWGKAKKLAREWGLDFSVSKARKLPYDPSGNIVLPEIFLLAESLRGMTPEALVQQVKRWRKKFGSQKFAED